MCLNPSDPAFKIAKLARFESSLGGSVNMGTTAKGKQRHDGNEKKEREWSFHAGIAD